MGTVRNYATSDLEDCINVFNRSVREVDTGDYSRQQLAAWAPEQVEESAWARRLARGLTLVYVHAGKVLGFIHLEGCYLDMLFVHPDCQRQGIAQRLFRQATANGPRDLAADVSITARPFFEAMGFRVVKRQEVERCGVKLNNFHMRPPDSLTGGGRLQNTPSV